MMVVGMLRHVHSYGASESSMFSYCVSKFIFNHTHVGFNFVDSFYEQASSRTS